MPEISGDDQRAAMLSVYYHALGRKLELRGAPAVLMPPEVEPIALGKALGTLRSASEIQFNRALWTIARVTPPLDGNMAVQLQRYPAELLDVLTAREEEKLLQFEELRRDYLSDAHLLGEALGSYARAGGDRERSRIDTYIGAFEDEDRGALSDAVELIGALGMRENAAGQKVAISIVDFLSDIADKRGETAAREAERLSKLSVEVGLPLTTFMEEFANAVAFTRSLPTSAGGAALTVLPTSSVTVQDARSLLTTITVTALVKTQDFRALCVGMDPQCWSMCSQAFKDSTYIDSSDYRPRPRRPDRVGRTFSSSPRLLEERVRIVWGISKQEIGYFHNLLNIRKFRLSPDEDPRSVSVEFDLNRCISSKIMWDIRPGGILIDQGYAKARPLGSGVYRVTMRKTLQFSDRTPYSGGAGWNDLGQLLNFLAPAALSWWVESEMYSHGCPDVLAFAAAAPPPTSDGTP